MNKRQKNRARLIGSVGKIIECNVLPSDLYTITVDDIPPGSFGLGGAAKMGGDARLSLGEALAMDGRFFIAPPSQVGPHDPYTCVRDEVKAAFFFCADISDSKAHKFEDTSPIELSAILGELAPEGLGAFHFIGKANALDIIDKLMKLAPIPENKRPYGKITTPEGLKEFFVMRTIPEGFSGVVDIQAFGISFKQAKGSNESLALSNETLNRLFYFTPGTSQSAGCLIHTHGLILSYDDTAPISAEDSINIGKEQKIPSSGRIVHIENTTKITSGTFKIAAVTNLTTT